MNIRNIAIIANVDHGKYTLVEGNKIYFIDSHHFLEGRIYKYKVLDEKAPF